MKNLLNKEINLAASLLSYIFVAFAVMTMIPAYPILVGAFFISFGIFHTFKNSRENNDILYTILLPVKKTDAVKAKYIFASVIELAGFALAFVLTMFRMTVLSDSEAYVSNPLMNANQAYLAYMLIVFALFNAIFIRGFFDTAYKLGVPFLVYGIAAFAVVTVAEVLHHIPTLTWLNNTATMYDGRMWIILAAAVAVYVLVTVVSEKAAEKAFEKVDM